MERLLDEAVDNAAEPPVLRIHPSPVATVDGKHVRSRYVESKVATQPDEADETIQRIRRRTASLLAASKTPVPAKTLREDYERDLGTCIRSADPTHRMDPVHVKAALEELVGAYSPLVHHRPNERLFDQLVKTLFVVLGGPDMLDQDRDAILALVPSLGQDAPEQLRERMQQRILTLLGASLGIGGMPDRHKLPVMNGFVRAAPSTVTRQSCAYVDRLRHEILEMCPAGQPAPLTVVAPALDTAVETLPTAVLSLVSMAQVGAMAQVKGHRDAPRHAIRHLLSSAQGADATGERMAFICLGAAIECQKDGSSHMLTPLLQAVTTMSSRAQPHELAAMGLALATSGLPREAVAGGLASLVGTVDPEPLQRIAQAYSQTAPFVVPIGPLHARLKSTATALLEHRLDVAPEEVLSLGREQELVETKATRAPELPSGEGDPVLARKFHECIAYLLGQKQPEPESNVTPTSAADLAGLFELALNRDFGLQMPLQGQPFAQLLRQLFQAWGALTNHGQDLLAFEAILDRLLYAAGGAAMPQRERQRMVDTFDDYCRARWQGATRDAATINRLEALRFSIEKAQQAGRLPAAPQVAKGVVRLWANRVKDFVLGWTTPQDAGIRMGMIGDSVARELSKAPPPLLCSAGMGLVAAAAERGDVAANGVADVRADYVSVAMHVMLSRLSQGADTEARLAHACLGASLACKEPAMRRGLLDAMAEAASAMSESQVRAMVAGYTSAHQGAPMTGWARERRAAGRDDKHGSASAGVERLLAAYKQAQAVRRGAVSGMSASSSARPPVHDAVLESLDSVLDELKGPTRQAAAGGRKSDGKGRRA